ncbi:MAG TPA: hypothetical protein DCL21_02180 [Alphaproteobacteria bacterium]|nr:hypothetical protein [Alphaproteobacteria bacterium]
MSTLQLVMDFAQKSNEKACVIFDAESFVKRGVFSESTVADVVKLLKYLKSNNIDFAVVTSSKRSKIHEHLALTGLNEYFKIVNTFHKDRLDMTVVKQQIADCNAKMPESQEKMNDNLIQYDKNAYFLLAAAEMGYLNKQCIAIENDAFGVMVTGCLGMCSTYLSPETGVFKLPENKKSVPNNVIAIKAVA